MKEKQDVTIEDYKELRINLAHTDSKVQGLSAALFRVLLVPCHFKHNATKPPYLKGSWGGGGGEITTSRWCKKRQTVSI